MPYELQENSRDFRLEDGFRIPAPLHFDLVEGVRVHTEFEISQDAPKCINAIMKFVIEGIEWGRSGVYQGGMRFHEEGGSLPIMHMNAAELSIEYIKDEDRPTAVQKINEWIDEIHLEVYNRYVSRRLMLSIVK